MNIQALDRSPPSGSGRSAAEVFGGVFTFACFVTAGLILLPGNDAGRLSPFCEHRAVLPALCLVLVTTASAGGSGPRQVAHALGAR